MKVATGYKIDYLDIKSEKEPLPSSLENKAKPVLIIRHKIIDGNYYCFEIFPPGSEVICVNSALCPQ